VDFVWACFATAERVEPDDAEDKWAGWSMWPSQ